MIADLNPYSEYKESGLPWLGQVPGHWSTERAKWLFTKMNRPVRGEDEVVTCFRDGMVTLRRNRRLRGFTEAIVFSGYQGIRKGDLVIHGMDAFAGAIGVSDSDGKGTPVYNVCQPQPGVNARYYVHLVREMSQSQWILALAKGIRERSTDFRFEMFGNQRVPLPPPEDQAAIVRFLDWANGRLERAIRAKRKVIALLNEQKQAIIHRAVTRGLNPNVPLKDSGVEWLGKVPEHWEIRRLRNVTEIRVSNIDKHINEGEKTVRLCNYVDVYKHDYIDSHINFMRASATSEEIERFNLVPGDVLITKDSEMWNDIGVPALVMESTNELISGYHLALLRPFTNMLSGGYLLRALQSKGLAYQFHVEAKGVTRYGLSHNSIKSIFVVLPSLPEQAAIVKYLNYFTANLDTAISRTSREIELLDEYRIRLIADVVTGKLDVREAAKALPQKDPLDFQDDDLDDIVNEDADRESDEIEVAQEEADE